MGRASAAAGDIFESLPDALGCEIEKPLIGFGVLHHGGGLSVHGQGQRSLGFVR